MARQRNDSAAGRILIVMGVVGYFLVMFVVCHVAKFDFSGDADVLLENLFMKIVRNPLDIFPIDWGLFGLASFLYGLVMAGVQVCYERQKATRPGEENGSAEWNFAFGKFAKKYAEPFGRSENVQKTGWIDKKTGAPWKPQKKWMGLGGDEPAKTKSFAVAVWKKFKQRLGRVKAEWREKWLDFKAKFRRGEDTSVPAKPYRDPTPRERKRYEKLCAMEQKWDMNLDHKKPKACLEERKRLEEEERKKALEGERIYEMRRQKWSGAVREPTEKREATLVPVNRNMILSQNVALSMDGRTTRKNCNTLILGGSGAGKTRFYLKPNLMQLNCSYVITDPSGEILQTMGKFLENAGYKIKVINLTNMDHSHCYNPFNYVREDADILVMIDVLTKNLTPPDSHSSDPFWPKSQAALLQAICFFLYKECRPSERNFTNVMKLLRAAIIKDDGSDYKSPLDIIFEDLEKKDPNHIAVMQYSIFKQAPAKTASTILTCAQVDLAPFNLDTIANLTGVDTIDMGSIGYEPTALFCITPTAKTTYNWIISLAYTQLFETLYYTAETQCKGLRLPVHVRFLLDEFANIGQIPDFEQKLSTMRKYEISCAIIIQNMAQLETMYKDSWKTIVGNCDEFIYLGGHESSSTEYVSKMLGKQTIKSRNTSKTYGRQGSSNISLNATGRELMTPDEIAHMSDQDCLVMVKGVMPFFDKKYDLLKHPNYHLTGDADEALLFDIAAEIQTPQNNVFGAKEKRQRERRKLEQQAKEETATTARRMPIRHPKNSTLAVTPESMVEAGMFQNEFNQDDIRYADIEVSGAHMPDDGFKLPPELEAESGAGFDSFLDGEAGEARMEEGTEHRNAVQMRDERGERRVEGSGMEDGGVVAAAILSDSKETMFINHLRVLNDIDFVVLDTETTGLGGDDEIVELSILSKHGALLYSSLFRSKKGLHPKAAEVNQIDVDAFAAAPLFQDEWEKIKDVLNGKKIMAFNADFDYQMVRQTMKRYGLDVSEADGLFEGYLDAMRIYLDIRPHGRNKISLQACCDALGMNVKETHRAADDCRLTLEMLKNVDKLKVNAPSMYYIESLR